MKRQQLQQIIQENPFLVPGGLAIAVILLIYITLGLADYHSDRQQAWQQQLQRNQSLVSLPPIEYWQQQLQHTQAELANVSAACYSAATAAQGAAAFRRDLEQVGEELEFKRLSINLSDPEYIDGTENIMHLRAEVGTASDQIPVRLDLWQQLRIRQPHMAIQELSLMLTPRGSIQLVLESCVTLPSEGKAS